MHSVSPAQQVLFSVWMFLSLPKIFKSKVIDKRSFVLVMEISYLNLGVKSEILNRLIQVDVGSDHVQCVVYRNGIQQLITFRMNLEQNYDIYRSSLVTDFTAGVDVRAHEYFL